MAERRSEDRMEQDTIAENDTTDAETMMPGMIDQRERDEHRDREPIRQRELESPEHEPTSREQREHTERELPEQEERETRSLLIAENTEENRRLHRFFEGFFSSMGLELVQMNIKTDVDQLHTTKVTTKLVGGC